jgi:hypothetical protein
MIVLNPMDGNSQGTLQFNQVLLVNSLSTVPAGKVWKVEGIMYNGGAPYALTQASFVLLGTQAQRGFYGLARFNINGQTVDIPSAISHDATMGIASPTALSWFPMWLPSNTTLQPVTNIRYFHVIEFNIIP